MKILDVSSFIFYYISYSGLLKIRLYFLAHCMHYTILTTLGRACSRSCQRLCSIWTFCTVNQVSNSFLVFMQRTSQALSPIPIVSFNAFYRQKGNIASMPVIMQLQICHLELFNSEYLHITVNQLNLMCN